MGREIRYMSDSAGVPGAPVGAPVGANSYSVGGFVADIYTLTVDTNTPAASYDFTIEGVSGNTSAISSVGQASAADTAAQIAADAAGNVDVSGAWLISVSGAVVTFQAKAIGRALTISESDAKMTLAQTSTASEGTGVGYGIAVELASDGTVNAADGSGTFVGITVRQNAGYTSAFDRATTANIPAGENASVLPSGRIVAQLDTGVSSVAASDTVYYRVGGTGILGSFTNTSDGGNTVALSGAIFNGEAQKIKNQPTYAAELMFSVV